MSEADTGRRARGGGGAARRAERTAVRIETARFIERNIPNFEILNDEALEIIEANAETVLEEIGVNFVENPGALALWREAGADVRGRAGAHPARSGAQAVRDRAVAVSPSTPATRSATSRSAGATWCWRRSTARPSCATPAGGRRYATIADFHNFVKLGYMSKWLHHSGGTVCEPTDVPVNKRHLDMLLAHMTLSDKPFMGSVTEPSRAAGFGRDVRRSCSARTSSTRTR